MENRNTEELETWGTPRARRMPGADFQCRVDRILVDLGVESSCEVTATCDGIWYELSGRVNSQWTRAALFSLVPAYAGGRHIVDKLSVGSVSPGGRSN